ncbi:hypothetical protein [Paraburkholderia fungorum]
MGAVLGASVPGSVPGNDQQREHFECERDQHLGFGELRDARGLLRDVGFMLSGDRRAGARGSGLQRPAAGAGDPADHRRDDLELQPGDAICTGPATTTTPGPVFANNEKAITLSNVVIGGVTYNSSLVG